MEILHGNAIGNDIPAQLSQKSLLRNWITVHIKIEEKKCIKNRRFTGHPPGTDFSPFWEPKRYQKLRKMKVKSSAEMEQAFFSQHAESIAPVSRNQGFSFAKNTKKQ